MNKIRPNCKLQKNLQRTKCIVILKRKQQKTPNFCYSGCIKIKTESTVDRYFLPFFKLDGRFTLLLFF